MKARLLDLRLSRSLFGLAFLIAAFFFARYLLIQQSDPTKVAQHISKIVAQREQVLDKAIISLESTIRNLQQSNKDIATELFSQAWLLQTDYLIAVLQKDELVFWNSSASFPIGILYDSLSNGLVNEKISGSYYIHRSLQIGD